RTRCVWTKGPTKPKGFGIRRTSWSNDRCWTRRGISRVSCCTNSRTRARGPTTGAFCSWLRSMISQELPRWRPSGRPAERRPADQDVAQVLGRDEVEAIPDLDDLPAAFMYLAVVVVAHRRTRLEVGLGPPRVQD